MFEPLVHWGFGDSPNAALSPAKQPPVKPVDVTLLNVWFSPARLATRTVVPNLTSVLSGWIFQPRLSRSDRMRCALAATSDAWNCCSVTSGSVTPGLHSGVVRLAL